jgi:hypothetical protein
VAGDMAAVQLSRESRKTLTVLVCDLLLTMCSVE